MLKQLKTGLKRKITRNRVKNELSSETPRISAEVRSEGAWFGRERLNPEAGGEAKARSDEKQSEAKARSDVRRFGPKGSQNRRNCCEQ